MGDGAVWAAEFSGGQRKPRNEGDVIFLAIVQNIFGAAVGKAVAVLDADDGDNGLCVLNLLDADFGQADVFDLALRLEIFERAELIFRGNFGIDAMQLIEVDAVETETTQAAFASGAEVLGLSVFNPAIGAGTIEAALGGNDQVGWIRLQGFGDDFFADVGAVGIGGVDEVDTELDGAAQNSNGFGAIGRLTPDAVSGDAHGAETEAGNGESVADGELAGV